MIYIAVSEFKTQAKISGELFWETQQIYPDFSSSWSKEKMAVTDAMGETE